MRRYWIEPQKITDTVVLIDGDAFHHIFDVCRQDVGSHFEVLSGDGKAYFVEVFERSKKSAQARIKETRNLPAIANPKICLALSLSRFSTMDAVVEKAVEMGVHHIIPFYSEFSFLRKKDSWPHGKIERWKKIILSATQQSGRGDLMGIQDPLELDQVLEIFNRTPQSLGLFAYEGETPIGIKSFLQEKKGSQSYQQVWLFVGSEGGFSTQEAQRFQSLGMSPVTLGDQVLRVETACITLLAILKYEFDLMKMQG